MKYILALLLALSLTFTGCAFFRADSTVAQKAADVQKLSYAAALVGTQEALRQNPEWRPRFEATFNVLNQIVENKRVDGLTLRNLLESLPIKELKSDEERIAITTATMIYDLSVTGDVTNIERVPYLNGAARGIRDGMRDALAVASFK